jgi:MYXO-CTERM domain-containing protein
VSDAFCDIEVDGHGTVAMEEEYLANVIFCENGDADIEALKAMAIAARSVAYWEIGFNGSICDSTDCQVFSCDGAPSSKHYQAVRETAGQYLYYGDEVTYGFYVRGDEPDEYCEGSADEAYVTYNEGNAGNDVKQTDLGWVSDPSEGGYGQNRGCMSQLGMQCLENEWEYDHVEILQFYYGDDIQVGQARGSCVPSSSSSDDGNSTSTSTSTSTTTGADETASGGSGNDTTDSTDTRGSDTGTRPTTDSDTGTATRGDSSGDTADTTATATAGDTADTTDSRGSDTDNAGDTDAGDTDAGDTDEPADSSDTRDSSSDSSSDSSADSSSDSSSDDDYDPYGDDDDRNTPGQGTASPWGGDDTDTDTDGAGARTENAGCSVGDRDDGRGGILFGLMGLLGLTVRRRNGSRA